MLQEKALAPEAVVVPDLQGIPGPDLGDDQHLVLGKAVLEEKLEPQEKEKQRGRREDKDGAALLEEVQNFFLGVHWEAFFFRLTK